MKYKVRLSMDDNYDVIELTPNKKYNENDFDSEEEEFNENRVHSGSLADCEAYIRLHEGGYM